MVALMKRILLVDDNPDILSALAELLDSEGYEVCKALNGEIAMAELAASGGRPFYAMVLDNFMPGITGEELVRRICSPAFPLKELPPVVVITTNPRSINLAGISARVALLPKPLGVDELLEMLDSFAKASPAE